MTTLPFTLQPIPEDKLNTFLLQYNAVLVGSRYYGTHSSNSDYDYMLCPLSYKSKDASIYDFMRELEFTRVLEDKITGKTYRGDIYTDAVYTTVIAGVKIDIQLMKNQVALDAKMRLYTLVRDTGIFKFITEKEDQVSVFQTMLDLEASTSIAQQKLDYDDEYHIYNVH